MAQDIALIENDTKSLTVPMNAEMDKVIKHFEGELLKVRTGRAHTSLVENLSVICYGQASPLKNLAALAAPEPRLITIQPWDASIIDDIERAIANSDLGISPINDGRIIRIQLPEMSSSRRSDLVKVLGKKLEECKVGIRNIRKDFNNIIRDSKKEKTISEDFSNRLSDILQDVTNSYIAKADELSKKKEAALTSI